MSSFIVSPSCINHIVDLLSSQTADTLCTDGCLHIEGFEPFYLLISAERNRLGIALLNLNRKAYLKRYSQTESEAEFDQDLPYKWRASGFNKFANSHDVTMDDLHNAIQAAKYCECFVYQCSEGEEFENTALYKLVQRATGILKNWIIEALPAYKHASWG